MLLSVPGFAQSAAPKAAAAQRYEYRAILVRGSESVKGLPHFGRNSLPGVFGEYRLEKAAAPRGGAETAVRVWMTREALYLAASSWPPARFAGKAVFSAAETFPPDDTPFRLNLYDRPFSAEGQGAEPRLWSAIIGFPASSGAEAVALIERFAQPFLDKLSYFLSNARTPEDASFPAIVEF